jgi:hypothetical protein
LVQEEGKEVFRPVTLDMVRLIKGEQHVNVACIIGLPFQIKFVKINSFRLREIESTLNATDPLDLKIWKLGSEPVEEDAAKIWMFGSYLLDELRDVFQFGDVKDLDGDFAGVFVCKGIELLKSATDSNDMSSRFSVLFS